MKIFEITLIIVLLALSSVRADNECDAVVDVMFVLDGSSSISRTNWDKVVAFVELVVKHYAFGELSANFGVVQFSSADKSKLEHPLTGDKASLLSTLSTMEQQRSFTSISLGIDLGVAELLDNGRPDVKKMIFLLTDGSQNQPGDPVESALIAQMAQIEIFGIGVSNGVDMDIIRTMATDPDSDHVYYVDDFYLLDGIVRSLNNKTCGAALGPLPDLPGETSEGTSEEELPLEDFTLPSDPFEDPTALPSDPLEDPTDLPSDSSLSSEVSDTNGGSSSSEVCDTEDLINYSSACSNQGYCIQEGPYFGCSCRAKTGKPLWVINGS
eukprot:TRINITY_DN104_c1_g1_i5.p1 TRINITY_DN104_c1_g1~~TRINITY_DN104_c1_g1_i5.p1  ORF type:complete len:325 (-),score=71.93 TRINITY_DN104_c1_g1_i5:230-1204(-)